MHLDGALQLAVVSELDVGVAAADMRDHHRVLALERLEQVVRGVDRARSLVWPSTRMCDERWIGRPSWR